MRQVKEAGFTLIEVLAALLVFSVAIIGLTHAGAESARAVSAIDDKMLAGIVADNQVILARKALSKPGIETGEVTSMSRIFEYEIETTKTDVEGLLSLAVKVRLKGQGQIVAERKAFQTGLVR